MTIEEIERILRNVAENQAKHDEMHSRHSADIAEIDRGIAALLNSQNRYEERMTRLDEVLHDLADRQLKNEDRFAELANSQVKNEERFAELAATQQQLAAAQIGYESRQQRLEEGFRQVAESHRMLVELAQIQEERIDGHDEAQVHTDARLDALIDSQIQLTQRVDTLTAGIAAVNGLVDRTDTRLDRITERLDLVGMRLDQVAGLQAENAEQIKALITAQTQVVRKPKAGASKKPAKKRRSAK